MSYVESNLVPGETVIYQTRLHWIVMLSHLIVGSLLLDLPGIALLIYALSHSEMGGGTLHAMEAGAFLLLFSGVAVILAGMLRRNTTEMAVTNRRVIIKTGLASRKTIEMLLNKVESIEVSESTIGRLLGYGTVVMIGSGGTAERDRKRAHPPQSGRQVQQQAGRLRDVQGARRLQRRELRR